MSNFERDMANTMLDAADARIASLEADKADLLRVLGVADEKIRSGEDARGQYIRENAALEARCRELEAALYEACQEVPVEMAVRLDKLLGRMHSLDSTSAETAGKQSHEHTLYAIECANFVEEVGCETCDLKIVGKKAPLETK